MSLKDHWKNSTTTEKVFFGAIIVLLIAVAANWEKISKEIANGFERYFGK